MQLSYPITFLLLTAMITARYFALVGGSFYVVWRRLAPRLERFRIQARSPSAADYRREIGYSLLTGVIFAAMGVLSKWLRAQPWSLAYENVADYGWAYWAFSLVAFMVLHDAYFYVTHRLMHHPLLYRRVHHVHHLSTNPTPWAAYAFHPFEALIEAGIVPLAQLVMPTHVSVVLVFAIASLALNVMGHLGYELYPSGFTRSALGQWVNTSTHHNLHHQTFRYDYGLYFNFWDRLFGTNHPEYHERFERLACRTGSGPFNEKTRSAPATASARPSGARSSISISSS